MGLAGNAALTELLSGALDSIVNARLTERYSPRGPGVASVSYAQANYESASQTKYVAGRLVMGSGAIALAEGLEKLDRAFSAGSLKLADYNKGLDALHAALGDTIPDINDARLGAGAAAMQMAFAGMESVAFYFGQIGEEVSRLAAAAKEAAAPVALVSGSIASTLTLITLNFPRSSGFSTRSLAMDPPLPVMDPFTMFWSDAAPMLRVSAAMTLAASALLFSFKVSSLFSSEGFSAMRLT